VSKAFTHGLGADSMIEAVGTQESMLQAIHATRPGGHVGFVGVGYGDSRSGRSARAGFGAVAAEAGPGKTVAVVGDGAVGLHAVLAAKQLGAERIIAMSRHPSRQRLAREYGATDIVEERGDGGVARIKELTHGLGADSMIEAVGTQESMLQAIHATRPGGHVGFVGVGYGVAVPGMELFWSLIHLHGGPAPVRRFLPELIDLIWNRQIDPGKVFDLELPLDEASAGYEAMDQRTAIKVLLHP
jgi:threonine dehydrogenase-like Zn-dependent dehydrogenase